MKATRITPIHHSILKHKSVEYECRLELVLEAAIELATSSKNRESLSQIVATLKNNAKIASSESKGSDPSEAMQSTALETQAATSQQTALSAPAHAVAPSGSQVWAAYSASMASNWNNPPPRNAKTNAQIKKLIEFVGIDNVRSLVCIDTVPSISPSVTPSSAPSSSPSNRPRFVPVALTDDATDDETDDETGP
jgi:hypothetical protein